MGEVTDGAEGVITKKMGPLPLVAWVGIGATGVFVWRRLHKPATAPVPAAAVGAPTSLAGTNDPTAMSSYQGDLLNTLQGVDSSNQAVNGTLQTLSDRLGAEQSAVTSTPGATGNPPTTTNPAPAPAPGLPFQNEISQLYQQFGYGQADPQGLAFFSQKAQNDPNGINAVAADLAWGAPNLDKSHQQATSDYYKFLHRAPDAGGLTWWAGQFQQNQGAAESKFESAAAHGAK